MIVRSKWLGLALLLSALLVASAAHAAPGMWFQTRYLSFSGAGSFQDNPGNLAVGDLNHDGIPDVACRAPAGNLQVLLGLGHGMLGTPIEVVPESVKVVACAIADFDGDGNPDLGAAGPTGVSVYFGDGTGASWERHALSYDWSMLCAAVDLDGDGLPDLCTASSPDYPIDIVLHSYLSRPARSFLSASQGDPLLYGDVWSMRAADFNGDGLGDLVLSGPYSSTPVVGLGIGDGTFTLSQPWTSHPLAPRSVDVADLNGDGVPDAVGAWDFTLAPLAGQGNGAFSALPAIDDFNRRNMEVRAADVNGDGLVDLVGTDLQQGRVTFRPGLPGGGFGSPLDSYVGCTPFGFELVDMDGDEAPDLVGQLLAIPSLYYQGTAGVKILFGNGQGGFGTEPVHAETGASYPLEAMVGDFDGDGLTDVAAKLDSAGAEFVGVWRSGPGRQLTRIQTLPVPSAFAVFTTGDMDGDGDLDLALLDSGGVIRMLRGLGDGTFAPPESVAAGCSNVLAFGDMNDDGIGDLVSGDASGILLFPGLGAGAFGPSIRVLWSGSLFPAAVRLVDLNGDGRLDYLVRWSNNGPDDVWVTVPGSTPVSNGSWMPQTYGDVQGADVNGDGRNDVIELLTYPSLSTYNGATLRVHLQQPDGSFGLTIDSPFGCAAHYQFAIVDVNGDGHPDVIARTDDGCLITLGTGDGHFEGLEELGGAWPTMYGAAYPEMPLGDFDGDGRLDFLLEEEQAYMPSLSIFYGRDAVPPTIAVTGPTSGTALEVGQPVDVTWTAGDDVALGDASVFVSRHGPGGPFAKLGDTSADAGSFGWEVTDPPSDSVTFKVVVRDADGNTSWDKSALLQSGQPSTDVGPGSLAATAVRLAVLKSPATGATVDLRIEMPVAGRAVVTLLDLQGRQCGVLFDGTLAAGESRMTRSLPTSNGSRPAGLYLIRLVAPAGSAATKLIVLN